uniref:Uncharacterized protein n=1 Tax=Lepeophtheirus salmonis TaxID=72036 RepID=A0A0K2UP92_LEPSM
MVRFKKKIEYLLRDSTKFRVPFRYS